MVEPSGYRAPEPNLEYEPVDIEVTSVASFGAALKGMAENIGTASPGITELLKDPAEGERGTGGGSPVGRDPRQMTLRKIGITHSEQMEDMGALIGNVKTGLGNLGIVTQRLISEFGSQDELNAADINQVRELVFGDDPRYQRPEEEV